MNAFGKDDMIKATQLTRAGRLKEAVAVLRGGFRPGLAPAGSNLLERLAGFARQAAPGPARSVPSPSGRFEARSFSNEAGKRAYKLFIPGALRPDAALIVMLHGCSQNPDDFAAGTRMNEVAQAEGFLVAYPAQNQAANMQKCWNWYNPTDQRRGAGEPAIVAGITSEIAAAFGIEPGRVFAAGLSAGGALAAILGATYPDLYAAIGVHSGLACGAASDMGSAFTAMRRGGTAAVPSTIPTIVFHGTKDHTVNPINADQVVARENEFSTRVLEGTANGLSYTRTIQTGPGGRPVTEKWLLHGAGHAWSGGSTAGSFASADGPDASREMLRFFRENKRK